MIKEYFSFTQKERIAIFTLIALILGIYFLPQFIMPAHKKPTARELEEFRRVEREYIANNKNLDGNNYIKQRSSSMDHAPPFTSEESKPARLFYFDPNTLEASGWKQLGLRDKTIGTIQKYLSKGGRFKKPEDLKKIFGLRPNEYERMKGYVSIKLGSIDPVNTKIQDQATVETTIKTPHSYETTNATAKAISIIDINSAGSEELISLPGIGYTLATRILNFREKLGGFYSINQVKETYGLPDSTFQKIQPWLTANALAIRKININTATLDGLKQHPYIRWNLANALIKYREQHGAFSTLQQLQQLGAWNIEVYNKVLPYLQLE